MCMSEVCEERPVLFRGKMRTFFGGVHESAINCYCLGEN